MSFSFTPLGVGDAFSARWYSSCLALEHEGRFVLVDCPPLLENVELALFTGGMDATLLVLRYGKTKYGEVLSAVSLLKRAQASPVWAVWNYADRRYLESPCIRSSNQCLLLEANDDRP